MPAARRASPDCRYVFRKELFIIATTRVSVNIDEEIKQKAQQIFGEMGLDMTTAIDSFLRTVVMEERIPYYIRTERAYRRELAAHEAYINAELDKAMAEAADPNTKWLSQDEIMANIRKRREARSRAI